VSFTAAAEAALPIVAGAFIAAALVALFATPVIRRIVGNLRILDHPDSRRVHDRPLPRAGGVAVVVAFVLVGGGLMLFGGALPGMPPLRSIEPENLFGLFGGAILATILGLLDDRFDLRARWQFLGQIALAGVAVISPSSPASPSPGSATRSARATSRSRPSSASASRWSGSSG
jgi:UDP-N-acetylmuramyl pentapeptide phosphotransferase/UDP-N-acetylglucosamine-1-phosphate transferase